jgi:hypothetical protein
VINNEIALRNTYDMLALLNSGGCMSWVQDGTLLGLVRDGHVMRWDHDTDIGLWTPTWKPACWNWLENAGFTSHSVLGTQQSGWQQRWTRNGVKTDIFFYYTDDAGNYCYGFQVEGGAGASSYIPTDASQVTRAVDTAIIAAGTNFSSWYTGGTTGTFVTEWCRCNPTTTQRTVIATSDVSNQHLHQYIAATTSRLRLADKVPAFIETANASVDNSINKGAFSYAGSVQSLCLNSGTVVPGTLAFSVAPTFLSIGGPSTNGTSITDTAVVLNNAIRKIKYFPTRLSDAQIKEITT